jgi:hypothetical protein
MPCITFKLVGTQLRGVSRCVLCRHQRRHTDS